ncbi:1-acyl-sn-glycerol-3-phosphate acyltransferase [Magnetospira sp. QH-2]|uniref:lysophospholipid acyltransferase family protein n=1 Tax=Magnetospira sp. (strain QH-2) TaxID=1288970 RepID=UPI0003E8104F|nr:lysophospholipid acyltransferase family protein [Magnetospira sp. QH-2]CCQ72531.1 putative acyltransferase [Magnetospira sp. QH-2]
MTEPTATAEHHQALEVLPASAAKSIFNLSLFGLSLLICLPVYGLLYPLGRTVRRGITGFWFRIACRLCGLRLTVKGKQTNARPTLLVSNHISYLDIPVLGAVTNATFVSKSDVASWPVFGFLARIAGTVFIERVPARVRSQRQELSDRLLSGEPLILFPEGTSTRGAHVLPFKSALFGVAQALPEGQDLTVQPLSIAYVRLSDGMPLRGLLQALYGWYGDMTLGPHLKAVMGLPGAQVEVTFHKPIAVSGLQDRKALAAQCQQQVALGLAESLGESRAA